MKHLFKILKISVIIALVVAFLNLIFGSEPWDELFSLGKLGLFFFYSFVLTSINWAYFSYFNSKIGWENAGIKRILIASAGSIILTMLGYFFSRLVDAVVFQGVAIEVFLQNESLKYYLAPLLFTTIVSLFFHLIYFYKALQEQKVTEQKIIAGTASAKFESLKNQLDPHFLFNSLNVLSSLIEENPEKAQKFTTSLSKIYRYVLEQKDKELVALQEELDFARTYVKLLEMRFENGVSLEISEEISNPDAKIIPLSLQLLLENTVKHNIANESKPLKIRIHQSEGYLEVENNLQKKEVLQQRKGLGLQNIINRYGHLTRRQVYIEETSNNFKVKLPILTKLVSIMKTEELEESNSYFKAQQRVKEIKEFYGHLITYALVMPFIIFINYYTYWDFKWFWFPLFGWGLGLSIHAFSVFGYGNNWEERKIRELMEKEEQQSKNWN